MAHPTFSGNPATLWRPPASLTPAPPTARTGIPLRLESLARLPHRVCGFPTPPYGECGFIASESIVNATMPQREETVKHFFGG
jgi:hypothetical protein